MGQPQTVITKGNPPEISGIPCTAKRTGDFLFGNNTSTRSIWISGTASSEQISK